MARFEITSPVARYTGVVVGVAFANGKAEVDSDKDRAALAYFRRKQYGVVDIAAREVEEKAAAKKAAKKAADEAPAEKAAGGAQ